MELIPNKGYFSIDYKRICHETVNQTVSIRKLEILKQFGLQPLPNAPQII